MSDSFMGEIRMGGWSFAPSNWAFCDGSLLLIEQHPTLYALIGTTYGGDGQTTFGIPDLQGRLPVHIADGYQIGQKGGEESVTLHDRHLPPHSHQVYCAPVATAPTPVGNAPATAPNDYATYNGANNPAPMGNLVGSAGGSASHENRMPALAITFIISLTGSYPPQG